MKILFTGGIKSGKSSHAEKRILDLAETKDPIYLATTELIDLEMENRIFEHRRKRSKRFHTIEEPIFLTKTIADIDGPVLVECMTMWINNALHHQISENEIFKEVENLLLLKNELIFVLNEVGLGIIPENHLSRKFADLSGRIGQQLALGCDEVFWCVAGISVKIK